MSPSVRKAATSAFAIQPILTASPSRSHFTTRLLSVPFAASFETRRSPSSSWFRPCNARVPQPSVQKAAGFDPFPWARLSALGPILPKPILSGDVRTRGLHLPFNLCILARPPGHLQIVNILQVQPELRVRLEVARQSQRRLRCDPPPLVYDFTDARRRHMKLQRQLVHRQAQRLHEILAQDFPRMHRSHQPLCFAHLLPRLPSVIAYIRPGFPLTYHNPSAIMSLVR